MLDYIIDNIICTKATQWILILLAVFMVACIPFGIYCDIKRSRKCESKGGVYLVRLNACVKSDSILLLGD